MQAYFKLQVKRINRAIRAFGLLPIIAYPLIVLGFLGGSYALFEKSELAAYILVFAALVSISKLAATDRNDFLRVCFKQRQYRLLRLAENYLVATPFALVLLYQHAFIEAFTLFVMSSMMAFNTLRPILNVTIPSPFYKQPFEFVVGFRNTFYLLLFAYILLCIAISVDNFNLGAFSIVILFLIVFSYYAKPETEYFVWSFSMSPKQFLGHKLKVAFWYTACIILPASLLLVSFYIQNVWSITLVVFTGFLLLLVVILAKYAVYPSEVSFPQAILIVMSVFFPPLLVITIPYFYKKSINRLNTILA